MYKKTIFLNLAFLFLLSFALCVFLDRNFVGFTFILACYLCVFRYLFYFKEMKDKNIIEFQNISIESAMYKGLISSIVASFLGLEFVWLGSKFLHYIPGYFLILASLFAVIYFYFLFYRNNSKNLGVLRFKWIFIVIFIYVTTILALQWHDNIDFRILIVPILMLPYPLFQIVYIKKQFNYNIRTIIMVFIFNWLIHCLYLYTLYLNQPFFLLIIGIVMILFSYFMDSLIKRVQSPESQLCVHR